MITKEVLDDMEDYEATERIKELKKELKKELTTNSNKLFPGNEIVQAKCDFEQHTRRSYLIAEIALLTNEFFGIEKLIPTMNEIIFMSHSFLVEEYCKKEV